MDNLKYEKLLFIEVRNARLNYLYHNLTLVPFTTSDDIRGKTYNWILTPTIEDRLGKALS